MDLESSDQNSVLPSLSMPSQQMVRYLQQQIQSLTNNYNQQNENIKQKNYLISQEQSADLNADIKGNLEIVLQDHNMRRQIFKKIKDRDPGTGRNIWVQMQKIEQFQQILYENQLLGQCYSNSNHSKFLNQLSKKITQGNICIYKFYDNMQKIINNFIKRQQQNKNQTNQNQNQNRIIYYNNFFVISINLVLDKILNHPNKEIRYANTKKVRDHMEKIKKMVRERN